MYIPVKGDRVFTLFRVGGFEDDTMYVVIGSNGISTFFIMKDGSSRINSGLYSIGDCIGFVDDGDWIEVPLYKAVKYIQRRRGDVREKTVHIKKIAVKVIVFLTYWLIGSLVIAAALSIFALTMPFWAVFVATLVGSFILWIMMLVWDWLNNEEASNG